MSALLLKGSFAAIGLLVMTYALAEGQPPSSEAAAEASFMAENRAAMKKMMEGMNIQPTGSVDSDFVAMMIPHHQGAVDMAAAELRYGHNEQLRRIAQGIVAQQQQEIAAMRQALGQSAPPGTEPKAMPKMDMKAP